MTSIIIDPGHGGTSCRAASTPLGSRMADGTHELATRLVDVLGPAAELSRRGDDNPSLADRTEVARRRGVPVFLSLHGGDLGAGAWIHSHAGDHSAALATELARAALPGLRGSVRRAPLAVLDPRWHHDDTAACLLELPSAVAVGSTDELIHGIAAGIRRFLDSYGHAGRYGQRLHPITGVRLPETTITRSRYRSTLYGLPEMDGHYFGRLPVGTHWGQLATILFLTALSTRWYLTEPTRPFGLGDIAREDGGPMPSHPSHQDGHCVDIYVVHNTGLQREWDVTRGPINAISRHSTQHYDQARTIRLAQLIDQLSQQFPVAWMYNNDPQVQAAVPWIRNDAQAGINPPQHDDHFHIRMRGTHPYTQDHVDSLLRMHYKM